MLTQLNILYYDYVKKSKRRETFVYEGLGFPIKLVNVPMKKMVGEWVIDIDFNKLQLEVFYALLSNPRSLSREELKFIPWTHENPSIYGWDEMRPC